jgi:diaminohydroxyphosphoribosylaminopyrimidine deaminase/5-amino-6-(5-phosphoribosylamino)uracil reductase
MTDDHWMRRALALAERGRGRVEPNPLVGAVVLDAAGQPVGEGWHRRFGEAHAEAHALAAAGGAARGGTLFVTLEPCCHHGKTPPCTDAVLASGVRRVVAAMVDPFPRVAGGGITLLNAAGLEVAVGVCEAEAKQLNAPFLKRVATGRPWVIAKWAMTLDGKLATAAGDSKWVSGPDSRAKVHELRGRVDAVLVGRGTVASDDPLLTARPPGPRIAARVVLTASGDLPDRCQLRATARDVPVIVFTTSVGAARLAGWAAAGAEVLSLGTDSGVVLDELGQRGMTNVLVEGGAGVFGAFRDAGAIDEVWAFVAPLLAGGSGPSPVGGAGVERMADALRLNQVTVEQVGGDVLIRGVLGEPGA